MQDNKKPVWLSTFHTFKNELETKVDRINKIILTVCILNIIIITGIVVYHIVK